MDTAVEQTAVSGLSAFIKTKELRDLLIKSWQNDAKDYANTAPKLKLETLEYLGLDPKDDANREPYLIDPYKSWMYGPYGVDDRYTLIGDHEKRDKRIFRESANYVHSVDFFQEIQGHIDSRKKLGVPGKMQILVTGSNLGFFNDEIRARFGHDVDIYGATVETDNSRLRKRRFVELIKRGSLELSDELQEYLTETIYRDDGPNVSDIHPNDRKWRSILQMQSAEPEFDMIVDTFGELAYCYDEKHPQIFELAFDAAIQKLNPGGHLYVAYMDYRGEKYAQEYCAQHHITIEVNRYTDRRGDPLRNYVITKPQESKKNTTNG